MSSLADFLLARIAEDEADARRDFGDDTSPGTWTTWVLAQCEAKRRIVEAYLYLTSDPELRGQAWTFALRLLALPYSDHPDFQQEWKPSPAPAVEPRTEQR